MDEALHEELVSLPSGSVINCGIKAELLAPQGQRGLHCSSGVMQGHLESGPSPVRHKRAPLCTYRLLPAARPFSQGRHSPLGLQRVRCNTQLALYFSCFIVCLKSMFKSSVKMTPSPIWGNKRLLQRHGAVRGTARWLPSFSGRACHQLITRASKTWQTP